jgi:hypothetical protein
MKTVRCVAGAVAGLVPVAAFAAGGTANAATGLPHADQAAVKSVKQVRPAERLQPAVYESYNQCRGTIPARAVNGPQSVHFWYHRSGPTTCIGTVGGRLKGNYANIFRVRLWVSGTLAISSRAPAFYHQKVFGSSNTGSLTLRIKTTNNVQVCDAFLSGTKVVAAPACKTM